jgi:hypothetical protein
MVSVIWYSPKFHIVNPLKRFGTSFKIFMKEIQKSKNKVSDLQRSVTAYFLQIDETVNPIIGLGKEIEESVIVQKILRYHH